MRYLGAAFALTLLSALQLAACSSRVTSLDTKRTLADLSMEERRQLCEDQFQYTRGRVSNQDLQRAQCADIAGVVENADTARARSACRRAFQACVSAPPPDPQVAAACDGFPTNAEGCTATVGEAVDCTEAQADALEKRASQADKACDARASESAEEPARPAACVRLESLCPKLSGDGASGARRR